MLDNILEIAEKYASGVKQVQDRRDQWMKKHLELKAWLEEIANFLNEKTTYKQGFFIDTLHAFNEDMHGTCADMPSVTFRSGPMPMLVAFRNSMGERKEYIEDGFSITFNPTITGQIIVMLLPHKSDLSAKPPEYINLSIINEPSLLTADVAHQIITAGMEIAYHSSFTGMSDMPAEQTEQEELHPPVQHNPIGFKRYETTQKVK